jgi:hypothetical protein
MPAAEPAPAGEGDRMSITVMKIDGTTEVIEPIPGTCRDALIEKGIYAGPPNSIKVTCDGDDVSDRPIAQYDGRKLMIQPKEEKGGR